MAGNVSLAPYLLQRQYIERPGRSLEARTKFARYGAASGWSIRTYDE